MAYKKYITRGGKVYGPYIYHSKRVDGKVVSEYHGTHSNKIDYKRFLWIGLGILVVALLVFGISSLGKRISGQATFDVKVDYKEGEAIDGVLKLSLKEGELLPTSSRLVLENNGEKYEYPLSDIISDEIVEGDFYVEGKTLSGTGSGYGVSGAKEVYPTVYFKLEVYSNQETTEEPEEVVEEVIEEPVEIVEEIPEDVVEPIQEEVVEEVAEEPGITGGAVSFFFGWMGTGRVVMELQKEIDGQVSIDNPFVYTLEEDETAEIKSKSVQTSLEKLNDNVINLKVEGNEVIITTDYSSEEEGFGEEYLGENTKALNIDLSDLNLILGEGELKISLMYSEEELISLATVLQEKKNKEGVQEEEPIQGEIEEIPEQEIIILTGINLTEEERAILIKEFGEITIEKIRSDGVNERLIIGYKLRDYKIEYSYDYLMDEKILESQMEADRIKWLKDIAATLLRKASVPQQEDTGEDSYSY